MRKLRIITAGAIASAALTAAAVVPFGTGGSANANAQTIKGRFGTITVQENNYLHKHPKFVGMMDSPKKVVQIGAYKGTKLVGGYFQDRGYFCAYANGNACINAINGGQYMGYWNYATAGVNGQFDQYWYGYVTNNWPWPSNEYNLGHNYNSNAVLAYYWTPNNRWTGASPDQALGNGGYITVDPQCDCATQFWVWEGSDQWVGVYSSAAHGGAVYFGYYNNVNNGAHAVNTTGGGARFVGFIKLG